MPIHEAHTDQAVHQTGHRLEGSPPDPRQQLGKDQLRLQAAALEAATNGILITDREGIIQWCNPAFIRITGFSPADVQGQSPRLLNSGRQTPEFYADLWATILARQVWRGELVNRRKDGSLYFEQQTIVPVLDADGQIEHFVAVKEDITQRVQTEATLEAERRRLFSLLEELPALVYLKAPDYTIRFANRRFRNLFGDPGEDLCYRLMHKRDRPCDTCSTTSVLQDKEPVEWEQTYPNGTCYQLYDYPFVDVDGTELVLQLGIDITGRKEAEAKLAQINRELLALSQAEHRERLFAEGLVRAIGALNSSLDLAEVLDAILEETQRVIPCHAAAVMLLEEDRVRLARTRGIDGSWESLEPLGAGVRLSAFPVFGTACLNRQPVLVPDVALARDWREVPGFEGMRSCALVPIVADKKVAGLIALFSDEVCYFTPESTRRLQVFADHAVLAIQNARLYQQTRESREELLSLSRRLVEVQENERRHVARELHDEASQALTSLLVQLKLMERLADDPRGVLEATSNLRGRVKEVMDDLHRLAMDLRPASLDHVGLVAALRQYCDGLHDKHGLLVELDTPSLEERLPSELETALYRIVQEALSNAIRHAQASRVDVILKLRGGKVVAVVKDDGQGFDPAAVGQRAHLGLLGMHERAETLGGTLTIETAPGKGTTVTVEVPYAH